MRVSTYDLLVRKINRGGYDPEEMLEMLDTFYAAGRISKEQYEELVARVQGN